MIMTDKEKHRVVPVADLLHEIQAERFFPFVVDAHIEDNVSSILLKRRGIYALQVNKVTFAPTPWIP